MAELFRSTEDLIAVLERRKFLVTPCRWLAPDPKHGQRQLTLRGSLSDGNVTLQGVGLRIVCSQESLSLPISIVLIVQFKSKQRAIARIDMNSQRHENRHAVCGDLQFLDAGNTHFHDTVLHRQITIDRLFSGEVGDLPIARPLSNMPEEFSKVMEKCGELLHIDNLTEIEEPQWQRRQFPF